MTQMLAVGCKAKSWLNLIELMREHARKASFEYFASRGFSTLYLRTCLSSIASSHLMSTQVNSSIDAIIGIVAEGNPGLSSYGLSSYLVLRVSSNKWICPIHSPGSTAQHLVTTNWLRSSDWLMDLRLLVSATVYG